MILHGGLVLSSVRHVPGIPDMLPLDGLGFRVIMEWGPGNQSKDGPWGPNS